MGKCDSILYVNSTFSVIFKQKGSDLSAIMSRSSPGIRSMLRQEDILFETADGTKLDDIEDLTFKDVYKKSYMGSLEFKTNAAVHGLFDFLLNWTDPRLDVRCSKSPLILCPVPFLHSELNQAQVSKSVVKSKDSKTNLYKLCITGIVLPQSLNKLLKMVHQNQQQFEELDCLIVFETNEPSINREIPSMKTIELKGADILTN
jgi:hypothetical protein